ncbi:pleckstrin homology domain-containing family G member 3 isoform X3 [Xyrichtys novacula]|uniref:Pleckstrin homology domain-containing family G member 3 isoform X3 n=1 Tax=Xyrichtys novacula TaxID=13765 RepID=A0AAV1GNY0_XYRNO|nr:pleckstrin homology domain-containing family G member 3 isoform X3 [Xyrichtys novacula]
MPEGSHSVLHQGSMGEESPQLSSPLSNGDHDPQHIELGPDCYSQLCMEPLDGEGERPVSLVSTLSSGSSRDSRSLFGSTVALPSSTTPPVQNEEDIDLELSPTGNTDDQAGSHSPTFDRPRGRWQEQLDPRAIGNQWNNNNAASDRKARGEIPHITASPVVTNAMAPNPKLTYVDRVVMEIIETERMYVKDLRSIVEDYLAHIIDMNNLPIRPEQVCALFGNIEDIYEFNSELLQSLDMCENDPVAIARCFVDKSEYFEIYTQYCTNYPNSVAALTDCMRSKTLAKFFRDRQAALKRSLPLGSYLLKPVQRILKYHLLLQEIAKHFDPDEEGCEVIQEAIDTMTGVAWYINDMKRKHEHAVRVQEIQSLLINWKGADLTTYGELVLEGTFHVLRAKNTRTLFLFEKMLLITKKRGEHYVYKTHISCSTLMLLDSAKDPLLFSVIHFKHPKQPHTVQAKSVEEKRIWGHHIKRLILENHNAIVPQKAKEAILDTSNYPGMYHYSPERLKKAEYCRADDFHQGGRNGRRRSEPAKQIIRTTKGWYIDDQRKEQSEQKSAEKEEIETHRREENHVDMAVKETLDTQVSMAELHPLNRVLQAKEGNHMEVQQNPCPESPVSPPQQEPVTPESQDTSRESIEEEEEESDSSGLIVEETSVLTNGELSEEEEEVLSDNKSILPSSVLDQAGVIAGHFIGSLSRRSSLVSEDLGPLACPSPSIENDVFKSPSACMDFEKQTQMFASSSSEPGKISEVDQSTPVQEPVVNALTEQERRSTLSKQDRLLIRKIRTYYEHAEHQDANFSIKRRESLSYIPAGLVRHLSRQLNSTPQEQAVPVHRRDLSRNRPTSWSVFDLPGLEKSKNVESHQKNELQEPLEAKPRSQGITNSSTTEGEEFRPSAEMVKVWQDMETEEEVQEVQKTTDEELNDSRLETIQDNSSDTLDVKTSKKPLQVLKEPEISSSPDCSFDSSAIRTNPAVEGGSCQDSKTPTEERSQSNQGHLPKIISFRGSMEEDQILQDMGKVKNKVFQLARQYSQRIKNNRPMIWQRNREQQQQQQQGLKSTPAANEEKVQSRKKGKPSMRLSLNTCDQAVIHEERSPSPVKNPSSGAGSQSTATGPQSPQSDTFHWPDVQELRTKYTETPRSKVTRSCTFPNGMLEFCTNRSYSSSLKYNSSSDLHKTLADSTRTQPKTVNKEGGPVVEDWPQTQQKLQPLLCRWSSLDHMLPLHEVQNFQEPVRDCHTISQVSVIRGTETSLNEDSDCSTKAKITESNLVKSLREKFQSLSTGM